MTRLTTAVALITVALLADKASPAAAQIPTADSTALVVLERITKDRWMHARQHAADVPFDSTRDVVRIREREMPGARLPWRTLLLRLRNLDIDLGVDSTNRWHHVRVELAPVTYFRHYDAAERARERRRGLMGPGAALSLPSARVWEVPVPTPLGDVAQGLTWVDTLSFVADPGEGLSETLDGVWRSRVVGDTTVGGRSLPLVRIDADVRYRAREVHDDRATDGDLVVERDVSGWVRGWLAVDTALGVRAAGTDSAAWEGTATLRMPDGRAFPSPVRYERTRMWALHDSAAFAALQQAARASGRRGMVIFEDPDDVVPDTTALVDSLFLAWRDTDDPNDRRRLQGRLVSLVRGRPVATRLTERMTTVLRERGDSAWSVAWLVRGGVFDRTVDLATVEAALPLLDDPGRAWRHGILPEWTYQALGEALLSATPILEPDTSRWFCDPDACRILIERAMGASEPRLRAAGLAGAMARAPARWHARVQAMADSGSLIARDALLLADGVGATWPAAPKLPMPEAGASWSEWLEWMGGEIRFGTSHRRALAMYEARTGRDPVAELARGWPPEADSARLVIGAILRAMDAVPAAGADELLEDFRSGSPARIEHATRELDRHLGRSASAADAERATELLAPILEALVTGLGPPWPSHPPDLAANMAYTLPTSFHGARGEGPILLLDEHLPPGLSEHLPPGLRTITQAAWEARPPREGGVLVRIFPVRTFGPFARVRWEWHARFDRSPDEPPEGYAGGSTLDVMTTSEGWRIVSGRAWIT